MAWQATPYALPSLISAIVSLLLIGYVWRYREEELARAFLVLLAAIGAWSLCYAVQLSHTTLPEQLVWQQLGLSIGGTIPTIWIVFATVYAGQAHRLSPPVVVLLLVDPTLFAVLSLTNGSHGFLWSSASLAPGLGLDLEFTAAYLLHITYAYVLVLAGVGLLVAVYLRSSAIYRRQAGLLVVGAVVPLAANVTFTLGVSPIRGLDLTTPTFALTGVVFALGLFRFDLLDLTPVARRRVLDEFGSGILVVDDRDRVIHANETARRVLPDVVVGGSVTDLLSVESVADLDGLVSRVDLGSRPRFHEFSVSSLSDFRDRQVGHVVALRDVTTTLEYEQRLEVANRLLRHNLRNDMNKILGWTEIARQDAEGDARDALDEVTTVAEEVADMSRKAKRIETTLAANDRSLVAVDAAPLVEDVVAGLREEWPDAGIAVVAPETAPVRAPEEGLLATAIRNVVENGLEHNDRERPQVDVAVRTGTGTDGGRTVISVADDGPGIPEVERAVLRSATETPLSHGSGLGLWLVRWITETAGGEVEFGENEPRGSVVTMRLRTA